MEGSRRTESGRCEAVRATPRRLEDLARRRSATQARIAQHRAASSIAAAALEAEDPWSHLEGIFPSEGGLIEQLDDAASRAAIARHAVITALQANPTWSGKVFAGMLGIGVERMRQLRKNAPESLAAIGVAAGRHSAITRPEWKPIRRPRRFPRAIQDESQDHDRTAVKELILAVAMEMGPEGMSTYLVNMSLGNSDLPSHNVEWKIVEMGRKGLLDTVKWSDGKRKVYTISQDGARWIRDRGIASLGARALNHAIQTLPRQKRGSGVPEELPQVTITSGDGRSATPRQWLDLPEKASSTGGEDLSSIYSTKRFDWTSEPQLLEPGWFDAEAFERGSPALRQVESGKRIERTGPLGDIRHAIRVGVHRALHAHAARAEMTMSELARRLAEHMNAVDPDYPRTRAKAITKLGVVPDEAEARLIEEITDAEAGSISRYPRNAPWAVSPRGRRAAPS